ncbi:MAG: DUF4369 domain-containing protein [Prevotella sp.]|nr:DUF4369 domain-containing protein [Prevotella sp.]
MNKLFYTLISLLGLASCGTTYNIQGSSNVSTLDGRMLYLKVLKDNDFKKLDSCDVVHGQFHFSGAFDSVAMASIFMDDESVLPLVLEGGDIDIKIDNTQQVVSGTPLNDELFQFFNKWNQLRSEQLELIHLHDQAIMDGSDMNKVVNELNAKSLKLSALEDSLVTTFVTENFDNVLGPGVFMMVTVGNPYPQLTPWIEDIMSKATARFKNDAYVKDYYQKAQENEQIMNGMREMPVAAPTTPPATPVAPAPTPNELAQPSVK